MLTMHKTTKIAAMLLGLAIFGFTPAGCSSTGAKRISGTTSSMADIEQLTQQGEQRLDALLSSMNALDEAERLDRAYGDLNENIEDLQDTSERLRDRRMTMEATAAEHAALWRNESSRLSGDRAQEISEQRREHFENSVADVGEELDQLRAAYEPFIAKLNDLQLMLSNDLTRRGVKLTRPVREDITDMAENLREHGADTRAALERARSDFSQ